MANLNRVTVMGVLGVTLKQSNSLTVVALLHSALQRPSIGRNKTTGERK